MTRDLESGKDLRSPTDDSRAPVSADGDRELQEDAHAYVQHVSIPQLPATLLKLKTYCKPRSMTRSENTQVLQVPVARERLHRECREKLN